MTASDLSLLTLAEARRELAARRVSAVELTETALRGIEEVEHVLDAYLHVDSDGALAQARAVDR